KFVKSKIALPLPEHITNWATLRQIDQMPYDQFMELFGNAVCSLYNFPSAEEIAQLPKDTDSSFSSGPDSDDSDDDDEDRQAGRGQAGPSGSGSKTTVQAREGDMMDAS
ncbi:hypothetical protein BD410DRAFT_808972, partial [Rickenella mellea]